MSQTRKGLIMTVKYGDDKELRERSNFITDPENYNVNSIHELMDVMKELDEHREKTRQFSRDSYVEGNYSYATKFDEFYVGSEDALYQFYGDIVCKPDEHDWILNDCVDHESFECPKHAFLLGASLGDI